MCVRVCTDAVIDTRKHELYRCARSCNHRVSDSHGANVNATRYIASLAEKLSVGCSTPCEPVRLTRALTMWAPTAQLCEPRTVQTPSASHGSPQSVTTKRLKAYIIHLTGYTEVSAAVMRELHAICVMQLVNRV